MARAADQGGILDHANPSQYDAKNPIILFIIQVRRRSRTSIQDKDVLGVESVVPEKQDERLWRHDCRIFVLSCHDEMKTLQADDKAATFGRGFSGMREADGR